MVISETRNNEPSNSVLLEELRSVKQAVTKTTVKQVNCLSEKLNDYYNIIHQQQFFSIVTGKTGSATESRHNWNV